MTPSAAAKQAPREEAEQEQEQQRQRRQRRQPASPSNSPASLERREFLRQHGGDAVRSGEEARAGRQLHGLKVAGAIMLTSFTMGAVKAFRDKGALPNRIMHLRIYGQAGALGGLAALGLVETLGGELFSVQRPVGDDGGGDGGGGDGEAQPLPHRS